MDDDMRKNGYSLEEMYFYWKNKEAIRKMKEKNAPLRLVSKSESRSEEEKIQDIQKKAA